MEKRTLEFNASRQKLTKSRDCDFTHLVAGSVGYLKAKFNFSDEGNAWAGCVMAASFWIGDTEYPVMLDKFGCCDIPPEVTASRVFYVSVSGMSAGEVSNYLITTNKIKIVQRGKI